MWPCWQACNNAAAAVCELTLTQESSVRHNITRSITTHQPFRVANCTSRYTFNVLHAANAVKKLILARTLASVQQLSAVFSSSITMCRGGDISPVALQTERNDRTSYKSETKDATMPQMSAGILMCRLILSRRVTVS